jgi:hypothetical protein
MSLAIRPRPVRFPGTAQNCGTRNCTSTVVEGTPGAIERVRAGIARAKASGTKSGKAFGRPVDLEKRIREALATPGRPCFHRIAAQFGVATGTA